MHCSHSCTWNCPRTYMVPGPAMVVDQPYTNKPVQHKRGKPGTMPFTSSSTFHDSLRPYSTAVSDSYSSSEAPKSLPQSPWSKMQAFKSLFTPRRTDTASLVSATTRTGVSWPAHKHMSSRRAAERRRRREWHASPDTLAGCELVAVLGRVGSGKTSLRRSDRSAQAKPVARKISVPCNFCRCMYRPFYFRFRPGDRGRARWAVARRARLPCLLRPQLVEQSLISFLAGKLKCDGGKPLCQQCIHRKGTTRM